MSGGVAGGLGGAAIGSIVPGVGTALGATLGSLAGSGISQLAGGGGASTTPAAQPVMTAQGGFQSYTPQAQQAQDYTWQGLQGQLGNLAWSGLNQLGGQSPAASVYPQYGALAQRAANADPGLAGSYGDYGSTALGANLSAMQQYNNLMAGPNNLVNYGTTAGSAGLGALGQVQQAMNNPLAGQLVNMTQQNPWMPQALQGAAGGAAIGGDIANQLTPLSSGLLTSSSQLAPAGQQAAATSQAQIPLLQQLAQGQANVGATLAGQAPGTSAGLAGAQQQILQSGMDPQNALFNQLSQQTRDQANAMNAMSGLAGTPYAAGLTNQANQNFDIAWQNQQLQRQAQAAQAAQGLAGQQLAGLTGAGNIYNQGAQGAGALAQAAGGLGQQGLANLLQGIQGGGNVMQQGLNLGQGGANLLTSTAAMPAQAQQQYINNMMQALTGQSNLTGAGVSQLANLTGQLGAAGQQPIAGLNALTAYGQQPYATALGQQQNALQALQNQTALGNQMIQLPQQVLNNALAYLGAGTNAAQVGGLLGQQAFNQNQAQFQGLGNLLQSGSNALFGNQGLAGALGGNSGGGAGSWLYNTLAGNPTSFITPGTDTALSDSISFANPLLG